MNVSTELGSVKGVTLLYEVHVFIRKIHIPAFEGGPSQIRWLKFVS
jgi:hypothetical protein